MFLVSPILDIRNEVQYKARENFYYSKADNILVSVHYLGKEVILFDQSECEYLGFKQSEMFVNLYWAKNNHLSIKAVEVANKLSERYLQLIDDLDNPKVDWISDQISGIVERCCLF